MKTVKVGMCFKDRRKKKHHIVNIFIDNNIEIVTYKHWSKKYKQWIYKSDETNLLLIHFDYGFEWY